MPLFSADQLLVQAVARLEAGQPAEAERQLRSFLVLQKDHPLALNLLGLAVWAAGRRSEAVGHFQKAVGVRRDFPEALVNLGNALQEEGEAEAAADAYRRALRIDGRLVEAHYNLGLLLAETGKAEAALDALRQAVGLAPRHGDGWCNLGRIADGLGLEEEALAAYDKAIAIRPDHAEAHLNRALTLLRRGDYEAGWAGYEWRRRLVAGSRVGAGKVWNWAERDLPGRPLLAGDLAEGRDLAGATLFVAAEQGFGDALQMVRFAASLAERGARVLWECAPALARLLAGAPGLAGIVRLGETPPAADLHCPMMSLPGLLRVGWPAVPAPVPYLKADPDLAARWAARMPATGDRTIGLVWAGGRDLGRDRQRSMPVRCLQPLLDLPGLRFVSLQPGADADPGERIRPLADGLADFADTAAAMASIDLVVSVDTAAAHLAGALGRPLIVLLPYVADWRWGRQDHSPWYPRARLLRQTAPGDWDGLVVRLAGILKDWAVRGA